MFNTRGIYLTSTEYLFSETGRDVLQEKLNYHNRPNNHEKSKKPNRPSWFLPISLRAPADFSERFKASVTGLYCNIFVHVLL